MSFVDGTMGAMSSGEQQPDQGRFRAAASMVGPSWHDHSGTRRCVR